MKLHISSPTAVLRILKRPSMIAEVLSITLDHYIYDPYHEAGLQMFRIKTPHLVEEEKHHVVVKRD